MKEQVNPEVTENSVINPLTYNENYIKYRGKCKEYVEALIAENLTLRAVRGYYYCPIWNKDEPHWWAVDTEGNIIDPTVKQFPSAGAGIYTEFNGICSCSNCGKEIKEEDALFDSNYVFCSGTCRLRFVGL